MYVKQNLLTEKLLFDYYMVSSPQDNENYSPFPYYLDRTVYELMIKSVEVLDKLVKKIINEAILNSNMNIFNMGYFPLQEKVLNLTLPLEPFFWTRYDAFQREDGGVFFSEFNYDKPCGQREIVVSYDLDQTDSPSSEFVGRFRNEFDRLCGNVKSKKQNPVVGILVDPTLYEEHHLAYLYIDLLKDMGYKFVIAGGNNFRVENEKVIAFGEEIDIVLRQFPTERLHELDDFEEILDLYDKGKILLLNDPRAVIGQVKSLFAYLWELVETNHPILTDIETEVIKNTIPYTTIFKSELTDELIRNKDNYVIKAIYGRYSKEVYIGKMIDLQNWLEIIEYVKKTESVHVIQQFCPIKKDITIKFDGRRFIDIEGYCNLGVYLTNGKYSGMFARWSNNYLSLDIDTWFTPIEIRDKSYAVINLVKKNKDKIWHRIADEAAFKYGFTWHYTGLLENYSLQAIILDQSTFNEIEAATNSLVQVFKKATNFVQKNIEKFGPLLGIDKQLYQLVSQNLTNNLVFVGRFDWVTNSKGNLKVLEFNSETPVGLVESIGLNDCINKKFRASLFNPNVNLKNKIKKTFNNIISDYQKHLNISNVGFVSSTFEEDWFNTSLIYEQVRKQPNKYIIGEISALHARGGKLHMYNTPLDAVYRFYPLEWMANNPNFEGVLDAMQNQTLSIIPPSTSINHSKAFFAILWILMKRGFFNKDEAEIIKKYIPQTVFRPEELDTDDYCIKPIYGREGEGVMLNYTEPILPNDLSDYVFQKRVDVQSILLDIYTVSKGNSSKEVVYPVIGAYVTGNEFAGIYTRAGDRITDKWAVYLPILVE